MALFGSTRASADTTGSVTGIGSPVERHDANGNVVPVSATHPQALTDVRSINFADCESDLRLYVPLVIVPSTQQSLQAWVGSSDCTDAAARNATTATCWRVDPGNGIASNTINPTITIPFRDVLAKINPTSRSPQYSPGTEAACTAQNVSGATTLKLQFFFVDASNAAVGTAQTVNLVVDTRASAVTGNISLEVGDTLLYVNVPSTTDSDVKTWNVYCDPPPPSANFDAASASSPPTNVCDASTAALVAPAVDDGGDAATDDGGDAASPATDASTIDAASGDASTSDSGTGGGTPTCTPPSNSIGKNCTTTSDVLFPGGGTTTSDDSGASTSTGTQRIIPGAYLCGTGGVSQTRIALKGLSNDVRYHVAVAATDGFGNVGPLSNVACEQPQPIIDFWDQYRSDGGEAGGGFCALEGAGMPAGSAVFGVGMIGAAVAWARRRKRG